MKTVVTITGIRPDFIRMSKIFKKLDQNFKHFLVHTGQHWDKMLSDVFFDELNIRKPDYNLEIGGVGKEHFHQLADISVKVIELFRKENIKPDIILFLGDSNSVTSSVSLKKEGYRIGHIEAGMRSYDKRMLEEINRIVCDHCSDLLFVYHEDYKKQCLKENITEESIHVIGNTIVEVCNEFRDEILSSEKLNNSILMDIHRPENFKYPLRLQNIMEYARLCKERFNLPIQMLEFNRTMNYLRDYNIDCSGIDFIGLMSYKNYLKRQYNSLFVIGDSGTCQEESCLLNTPVIVPRDYTERPQSMENNCSFLLSVENEEKWEKSFEYLENVFNGAKINTKWLGDGTTSDKIIGIINGC